MHHFFSSYSVPLRTRRFVRTRRFIRVGRLVSVLLSCALLSACISTVVGAVVDTSIEIVKIPFKVVGAVVDVATPDAKKLPDEQEAAEPESISESDVQP